MATFEVKVYKLIIEEHPNADKLELAKIGDYRSIVMKGQYKTGDLGVYIPEAAIVPDWLIEQLGLVGKLAGKKQNRVKAIKFRGILSQGLVVAMSKYPFNTSKEEIGYDAQGMMLGVSKPFSEHSKTNKIVTFAPEGTDVTEFLGITKYEPAIPTNMQGEVFNTFGMTLKYDIENIQKYPNTFKDGEEISIGEKIHGTWCCMGSHPEISIPIVTSKGMSEKGLAFKLNEVNEGNLYIRALNATKDENDLTVIDRMYKVLNLDKNETPLYILGEAFEGGIQDLTYGGEREQFRIFDIYVGQPTEGKYLAPNEITINANLVGAKTVPILFTGAYSKDIINKYTNGTETVSGKNCHIREGIVIKPMIERRNDEIGRVILKSVSENYLLRKGKKITEFN